MEANLQIPEDAPWIPTAYTKTGATHSKGAIVEAFASIFISAIDGKNKGKKVKLAQWQIWLLMNILQTGPNGLFKYRECLVMLPRKNGKTFLIAIIMLFMLLFAPSYSQLYSGAKDKFQAENVFNMLKAWIEMNPELSRILKITKSRSLITNTVTGTAYKALAADGGSLHGTNPYFVIIDEGHTMLTKKHRDFVTSLTSGMGALTESMLVYISTSGAKIDGNLLGDLYKYGKKLAEGKEVNEAFGFYCWEADADADDLTDPEVWKKANPMLAEGYLDIDVMKANFNTMKNINISEFLRFRLNIWISVAGDPFIQPGNWTKIYDEGAELTKGEDVVVGFDGSKNGDSTVIMVQSVETGLLKVWQAWERPADAEPGFFINRQDIENSFISLHNTYNVKLIWADRFYYENDLVAWAHPDNGYDWDIAIIPQGERMISYAKDFQKDIVEENISHSGEELLSRHLANTFAHDEKVFVKEAIRTTNRIDATVASILANGARREVLSQVEEEAPQAYFFN